MDGHVYQHVHRHVFRHVRRHVCGHENNARPLLNWIWMQASYIKTARKCDPDGCWANPWFIDRRCAVSFLSKKNAFLLAPCVGMRKGVCVAMRTSMRLVMNAPCRVRDVAHWHISYGILVMAY